MMESHRNLGDKEKWNEKKPFGGGKKRQQPWGRVVTNPLGGGGPGREGSSSRLSQGTALVTKLRRDV